MNPNRPSKQTTEPVDGSGLGRPVRLGLLLDSYRVPAWTFRLLEQLASAPYVSLEVVVLNAAAPPDGEAGDRVSSGVAYALVTWLQARLSKPPLEDATEMTSARELLAEVPSIAVHPERAGVHDRLTAEDVATLAARDLDVIFRVGFRTLEGEVLAAARHGVWSYQLGGEGDGAGLPAGLWEVLDHAPTTGASLRVEREPPDGGLVIARCEGRTWRNSYRVNASVLRWNALELMPRALKSLHDRGPAMLRDAGASADPGSTSSAAPRPLTNARMLRWAADVTLDVARSTAWRAVYDSQWCMFYHWGDGELETRMSRFTALRPPQDRFWADPHVVVHDGAHYIFFEELPYLTGRGHISVVRVDGDGQVGPPTRVLERPYHLSYPFTLRYQGELYMIPETASNARVELYRCVRFPDQWEHVRDLMTDVRLTDATLLEHGGRWWLFGSLPSSTRAGGQGYDELHVFHADDPTSDAWAPHPRNPVKTGVSGARSAGPFIRRGGKLYRPGQDGAVCYGHHIRLMEVLALDEHEYREREVEQILPGWDPSVRTVHTIGHQGKLTVADGQLRRPKDLRSLYGKVGRRLRSIVRR